MTSARYFLCVLAAFLLSIPSAVAAGEKKLPPLNGSLKVTFEKGTMITEKTSLVELVLEFYPATDDEQTL